MSVAFEVLLQYALWMSGGRLQIHALVRRTVAAAPRSSFEQHFARLHAALVDDERWWDRDGELGRLAAVLNASVDAEVGLEHPATRGQPRRLEVLQWTMKRTCLMQLLLCVHVDMRAAWVLVTRLGADVARAAELLGWPEAEVEAHVAGAHALLAETLGGFCEHVAADNPCRCAGRLGPALQAGLVRDAGALFPHQPHDALRGLPLDELYRSLPSIDLESAAARAASPPSRSPEPPKIVKLR